MCAKPWSSAEEMIISEPITEGKEISSTTMEGGGWGLWMDVEEVDSAVKASPLCTAQRIFQGAEDMSHIVYNRFIGKVLIMLMT